ncbi:MAG: TIGR04452 family lipoprotein [Leptospiraceae bacterium]|nr:TIGR04452 family lipoprotein [Leptospiraceae bacterium]MCP5496168.1 TIGR04452 family lipoprotein [Leptospiraceae bacterium]
MKIKLIITTLTIFLIGNCIIMNAAGANYKRVKGDEVKTRIQTAAAVADFMYFLLYGTDTYYISYTSVLGPIFVSIQEDKYYYEKDVDKCTEGIKTRLGLVLGADLVTLVYNKCSSLEPVDGYLLGKPFPKL